MVHPYHVKKRKRILIYDNELETPQKILLSKRKQMQKKLAEWFHSCEFQEQAKFIYVDRNHSSSRCRIGRKGQEGTFWSDENILCLDQGSDYMVVDIEGYV